MRDRKIQASVVDARAEPGGVMVRFAPRFGPAREIEDWIPLGPTGHLAAIQGIGRLIRILRAGRVRVPSSPSDLDPERAAALLQRCRGVAVVLRIERRVERVLTLWTESGVERIRGVVDYAEDRDGLTVRRVGGHSALRVPRRGFVRFALSSQDHLEVLSVEAPTRRSLR
jgi:hypothetical protein